MLIFERVDGPVARLPPGARRLRQLHRSRQMPIHRRDAQQVA